MGPHPPVLIDGYALRHANPHVSYETGRLDGAFQKEDDDP